MVPDGPRPPWVLQTFSRYAFVVMICQVHGTSQSFIAHHLPRPICQLANLSEA